MGGRREVGSPQRGVRQFMQGSLLVVPGPARGSRGRDHYASLAPAARLTPQHAHPQGLSQTSRALNNNAMSSFFSHATSEGNERTALESVSALSPGAPRARSS